MKNPGMLRTFIQITSLCLALASSFFLLKSALTVSPRDILGLAAIQFGGYNDRLVQSLTQQKADTFVGFGLVFASFILSLVNIAKPTYCDEFVVSRRGLIVAVLTSVLVSVFAYATANHLQRRWYTETLRTKETVATSQGEEERPGPSHVTSGPRSQEPQEPPGEPRTHSVSLLGVIGAIVSTLILSIGVRPLVAAATKKNELPPPPGVDQAKWGALTDCCCGAQFLGILECLIALSAFWRDEPLIIGAWLAFKVAAKWDVWKNIVQVPLTLGEGTDPLSWLIARNAWGTRLLNRFLIGTLANVLVGLLVASLGRYIVRLS